MKKNLKKDIRIGIIGAGPGGLAAAESLKEKGYTNVTIFERSARAGGQSLSLTYKTQTGKEIIYDIGSIQPISTNVGHFAKLLKKYNMHIAKTGLPVKSYSFEKKVYIVDYSKSPIGFPFTVTNVWYFSLDMLKLSKSIIKYRKLMQPGFTAFPKKYLNELSCPYEEWIDKQNFLLIGQPIKYLIGIVLNWWHFENRKKIPVMKFLKSIMQFIKFSGRYINGKVRMMVEGYQELWNRIAKNHDVRYKCEIKKISRDRNVQIELASGEKFTFDKLIITCLPSYLFDVMDVTDEEKDIFSKIICSPAWRVAFTSENLPHDGYYNFIESYHDPHFPNRLMLYFPIAQCDEKNWLFTGNLSYNKKEGIEEVLKNIEKHLKENFNADITWVKSVFWKDFAPFYAPEDVRNGIYYKIDALQGKNNTYYSGGFISGASHPIVINFSYQLVKTFF